MKNFYRQNRGLLFFLILMVLFRSAIADWNSVPTGSMKPTIVEGDRILVNKVAYDVRLPFSKTPLLKRADPSRGDIIVFDSEVAGKRLVKRVIGMPGDQVEMRDNVVIIDNKPLGYQPVASSGQWHKFFEALPGAPHLMQARANMASSFSNFNAITVPAQHYLVLGDNRDNSADSRVIGLVPRSEIIGRSSSVVMSFDYDNYYLPRTERFFKGLML